MNEETSETSLKSNFSECEVIVENVLQDKYGAEKNDKLRFCVEKLQQIVATISKLSLFSTNDDVEELPTSSIYYLLVPAYLGYVLEEYNAGLEKRATYLAAAKIHYRQFLENLLVYRLINFKLSWLHSDEDEEDDEKKLSGTTKRSGRDADFLNASQRRAEKIARFSQRKELENILSQLRCQQLHNGDESTQRQTLLTLIRLWAIRAIEALSNIDEELKILEFREKNRGRELPAKGQSFSGGVPTQSFIIAKTDAQKAVFGLGYPSIPTYTVDEWYDQMAAKKGFGQFSNKTINGTQGRDNDDDFDEDDLDETTREAKRQKAIQSDEWKDSHRRGWGNTHNKG